MNKIYHLFTGIALVGATLSSTISKAQSNKIYCGDDIIKQKLESKYPGYKQNVQNTFNEIEQKAGAIRSNDPYTVNVVIHVLYKNADENLPDSVINSQMDVLNEDYNRLNPDTANLRSVFHQIAGSTNIHFNLAQVIRKSTTVDFSIDLFGGGMPNEMKWDSLGGSSAVDPAHYLNLWICKIQPLMIFGQPAGQVLGFAFPPANMSNWPAGQSAPVPGEDGVVIDFRCIGRNNPNPISADGTNTLVILGRTPSHEVGHYLGLRHIWGDGGGFGGGGNNCTGNDGIADTPKADNQSNFDCDTTKNTCVDTLAWTSADAPDLIENYMDYSAEACMNMFTQGQAAHMRASLEGPRSGLLDPTGVKSAILEKNIKVFPNPAKDQLTISGLGNVLSGAELVDVLGKTVLSLNSNTLINEITLDLTNVNAGTYFVKTNTINGTISTKKVLVVK